MYKLGSTFDGSNLDQRHVICDLHLVVVWMNDDFRAEHVDPLVNRSWLGPVLGTDRQLQTLAAVPETEQVDVHALFDRCRRYFKRQYSTYYFEVRESLCKCVTGSIRTYSWQFREKGSLSES